MNLLITGAWNHTPEQLEMIRTMGHQVHLLQNEKDPLPLPYEAVEGVICNGLFLYHPIERFSALRFIQLTSAGLDRVPVDYIRKQGIALYNAQGVYSIPMAEFAISSVLQFYKQNSFFVANQKLHKWEKNRQIRELFGKTVCVVGCGSVGIECARRFKAFGCQVIGVNRSLKQEHCFDKLLPLTDLLHGIAVADVVVLTIALTQETRHLINENALAVLRDGCVLVNVARGGIVDTGALTRALTHRNIYAALDVFEEEPLSADSLLWNLNNVIITPHNSFVGGHNAQRLFSVIKGNLINGSSNG